MRYELWGENPTGLRRLSALIRNLSPQSASARIVVDGADWGTTQEFLASLLEMMDMNNRLTYSAASGKKAPWDPVKVERPKNKRQAQQRRKPSPKSDLIALFGGGGAGGVKVD